MDGADTRFVLLLMLKERVVAGKATCFRIDENGVLWFQNRLVVPKVPELHQQILDEAHLS